MATTEYLNGPEVERALQSVADKASDASTISAEIVAIGLAAARSEAPRRTGQLAASLSADVGANVSELTSDVGYAPFNEFGTVHMAGVRFMGAGYEAMKERAEGIATKWMEGVLSDADRMA